jgi:hypothetical protein
MRRFAICSLCALSIASFAGSGSAASVTWAFAGTVRQIDESSDGRGLPSSFGVGIGTPMTGTFTFESNAPGTTYPPGGEVVYQDVDSEELTTGSWAVGSTGTGEWDLELAAPANGLPSFATVQSLFLDSTGTFTYVKATFDFYGPTFPTTTDIPIRPPAVSALSPWGPSNWDSYGPGVNLEACYPGLGRLTCLEVREDFTSLTLVAPEPEVLALAALGPAALVASRRRASQRS